MSDIVQRINEVANMKILRNLRWEEVIYGFFNMYDSAKSMSMNDKNKKAQIAMKNAGSMLEMLQKFIDAYPGQEKLNDSARKETEMLMKKMG